MTHRAEDGTVWVAAEPPGRCEFCGDVAETRPYGPNGEQVCVACGKKNPEAVERALAELFR